METLYNKEYFIKKFEAIPEEEIGQESLDNKCALYHCGVTLVDGIYKYTPEGEALVKVIREITGRSIIWVNDDPTSTAKQNILRALRS
jgi:hypothetical protein